MKDHPVEPRTPPRQRTARLPTEKQGELKPKNAFEGLTLTEVVEELLRVHMARKAKRSDKAKEED